MFEVNEEIIDRLVIDYRSENNIEIGEPLDGDECEEIVDLVKLELQMREGNITNGEYEEGKNKIRSQKFSFSDWIDTEVIDRLLEDFIVEHKRIFRTTMKVDFKTKKKLWLKILEEIPSLLEEING